MSPNKGIVSGDKNILDIILSALGFNPMRLRWRWRRYKQDLSRWRNATQNRAQAARYEHKTCHVCSAPVDRDEKECPRCGAALASSSVDKASRLLQFIVPEGGFVYTTLIGIVIVALFGVMVAQAPETLWPSSREAVIRQIDLALQLGANSSYYWTVDPPHVWRLVTAMFVHFGLIHFLFNIYALIQLGPLLEEVYGRSRFLALYFLCGLGGSVASIVVHWNVPTASAGASGALFGLIGTSLVYGWRTGGALGRSLTSQMLQWGVFALLFGILVSADNAAHIGGAVTGAGLAYVVSAKDRPSPVSQTVWSLVELVCLLLFVGSFVALFIYGHDYEYIHNAILDAQKGQ